MTFPNMTLLDMLVVLACVLLLFLYHRKRSSSRSLPLPPGPKPLPLLGNLLDMPVNHEYRTYAQWGKQYGEVMHVSTLGTHIVVLTTVAAANELLDGRSEIYSSRPFIPMLHEPSLMNSNRQFVFKRYSPEWRRQRRLFTRHLGPTASRAFFENLTRSTHTLLHSMLHHSEQFPTHLRYAAAETILDIAYGYQVQPTDDPLVALLEGASEIAAQGVLPGGYLVNVFPWLKYVPSWAPGAGFKTLAAQERDIEQNIVDVTYEDAQRKIAEGTASPSFMTNALTDPSLENLEDIKSVALTMYGGNARIVPTLVIDDSSASLHTAAVDTILSSMLSCILAVVLDPIIQRRAQLELDDVLGPVASSTFRLPTFADRPQLPYIDAIVKESLRWLPVVPMGVPHSTTKEDVYQGWRIPKGTIVIANSWSMLHDEETYPEPLTFRPERFLGENPAPHPGTRGCFGFGRRECPGRNLAEASLWIQIASLLAVFTVSPAKDKDGRDIDVNYAREPLPGIFLRPQNFPCRIAPRSRETEMRIHEIHEQAKWSGT